MKKFLAVFLALTMCLGMVSGVFAASKEFTDVKTTDWFYNDVKTAVELGLVNGKTETTYAPADNLTYAEAIKLAACMHQLYTTGKINFKAGDPWYKPYADYCKAAKIINKEYNYQENATRAGYMGIFANALPGDGLKAINSVADNSIPDVPSSEDFAEGVYKLYRAGILQGVDAAHNCSPHNNITRSEVAAILTRMMNADKRVKFTLGEEEKKEEKKEEKSEELAIKTQPKDATVDFEKAANFSVEATGGTAPYKYQWMYNVDNAWRDVSIDLGECEGVTSDKLSVKNFEAGTVKIRCVVTDAEGTKVVSNTVNFITKEAEKVDPLTVKKHPIGGALDVGGSIVTSIEVSGGVEPYTYQWEYNDGSEWKNVTADLGKVSGEKTAKVSIKATSAASYKVRCVIKDAKGNKVETNETEFTFKAEDKFRIEKEPENTTVEAGKTASISVKVAGGTEPYKYEWACDADGKLYSLTNAIGCTGSDTDTLKYTPSSAGEMVVCCIVTDAKNAKVTTKNVTITSTASTEEPKVEEKPVTEPMKLTKLLPRSVNVGLDETATFEVDVIGGTAPYKYQWYFECATWTKLDEQQISGLEGATSAKMSLTRKVPEVIDIKCVITDAKGAKLTSNTVKLTIENKNPMAFADQPKDVTVKTGEKAVVSVKVQNNVGDVKYQWQMDISGKGSSWVPLQDNELITGTKASELTLESKAASNIIVRCVATDAAGTRVESNGVKVTFE